MLTCRFKYWDILFHEQMINQRGNSCKISPSDLSMPQVSTNYFLTIMHILVS